MRHIVFIGGIHGAGKGTICRLICDQTSFTHITASELLKWNEISEFNNKYVENIQNTQKRLLEGIETILEENKNYILDGHFCLFNSEGGVEKIPMETFSKIAPKLIAVVYSKVEIIKERLEKRDQITYNFDILEQMQITEIKHAKTVAKTLGIPFVLLQKESYNDLINQITNLDQNG